MTHTGMPPLKRYTDADMARCAREDEKGSRFGGTVAEHRAAFARDRARVLHSAAFRRLADKTQVVGPQEGDNTRTRLTHSLEVAQIARGIAAGIGVDEDLCDLAGLVHDIGHPPYGHNGETQLNRLAADCGGFEGNAQTLRILVRLEPKVLLPGGKSVGLNLTRASLAAACKYPWGRLDENGGIRRKYGAYDDDMDVFQWIYGGQKHAEKSIEAQVMDWADDVAYSVHDVEDGIQQGRITIKVLWDFVELARLAELGANAFGGNPEDLVAAADRLRQLPVVANACDFNADLQSFVALKALTSELVGRYVGATVTATRAEETNEGGVSRLVIPAEAYAEVMMLKTIAVLYVMENPVHLRRQDRQRERITRVHDYITQGAPGTLDPLFAGWWNTALNDTARKRVIIDQIASLTESRLERLAKEAAGYDGFIG